MHGFGGETLLKATTLRTKDTQVKYRICSRNLRTFFSILAAEKSGYVKYADFFVVLIWLYFSITENTARFVNILL